MTIDEAIEKERKAAEKYRQSHKDESNYDYCNKMTEEHEQLADWLEELKWYKSQFTYTEEVVKEMTQQSYNKAIDDFMEKIDDDICCDCSKCGNGCRLLELREISKQLKGGVSE